MIYIIGSGLSGVAAAAALVKRGFRPTILDAGVRAGPHSIALKSRLASAEPDAWTPEDLAQLKRTGPAASTGIPQKLLFGSNFAYRDVDRATSARFRRASILRSFAHGGFSNVWGAVIQPWPQAEFRCWPIGFQELAKHYSSVRELICPSGLSVRSSMQTHALHSDLERHQRQLDAEGVRFDYATLAVRTSDDDIGKACRHCGLCLYGCPYDSIFSAASQLSRMVRQGQVAYISDVLVDRISILSHGVRVEARSSKDNAPLTFNARTAFLAAGLLETVRIILNSGNFPPTPLCVQQSDIFTIPLLRYRSIPNISRERLHTLCQMIVEINDAAICADSVQLQLYGYNDLYSRILASRLGRLSYPLQPLIREVSERLVVAFGYLHSNVSSRVSVTRTRDGRLHVQGDVSHETKSIGHAIVRKLFRIRNCFRAAPIPLQLRFDDPGGGHRSGGCFPMKAVPAGLEADRWGRIRSLPGIHVVDSSVLPSLPAAPLAFTVMANAHRIASGCPIDNDD
ncbi:MAG: NAD(P)-binding protein [Acidobacteria bacterium]|nr:NAD(P)-binding protein [Acidobacteriota bacterium]